jgi:hypothetical protein
MKTLFRTAVLLVLVAGVSRPAEAKDCHERLVPDVFGIWGCSSSFTKEGTPDVGGDKADILQARHKRLWWWIHSDDRIKIELKEFKVKAQAPGTLPPDCPGTFKIDGTTVAYPGHCEFTVVDKHAGWTLVKLAVDSGAIGATYKFKIVITDDKGPYEIDPEIEIDTAHNMFFQLIVLLPVVGLLIVVTLVTVRLIRMFRRRSGEAR